MTYETIPYSVLKSNNIVIDLKIVISYLKRFNWTTFNETLELNIVVADCEYSLQMRSRWLSEQEPRVGWHLVPGTRLLAYLHR